MRTAAVLFSLILLGSVGAGSYWIGSRSAAAAHEAALVAASVGDPARQRKVLYYRNPMGLPDTSPTPKKDPMGMDYIAVLEGEDEDEDAGRTGAAPSSRQVRVSTEKVQKLGVRTETASPRLLGRTVRASGRVEPDERRVFAIAPKFEGYVERLHVNVTGQPVVLGQPLFEVYSPELVSAQREYLIAVDGLQSMKEASADAQAGMKQLAESSLTRLRNWDLAPEQAAALVKAGEASRTVTLRSPVSGIVTEKRALQGTRFMPGETLYQVTDLSTVWVVADVFEQDIGLIRTGSKAGVTINAYPERKFTGRISYIYPTLEAQTRTVPVRIELANPGQLLKLSMFAQVEILVSKAAVLAVPHSAVIDSGTRQIVLVQAGEGRFEPREVALGARGDQYVEVLSGVRDGEQVVVSANFLIDAESNLKAAVGGMGDPAVTRPTAPAGVGHRARGVVAAVDRDAGTLSIEHGPVPSLKWPAMTMEFRAANAALVGGLKPRQAVVFEFVERSPGEFVVTSIGEPTPRRAAPAPVAAPAVRPGASAATTHSGH